MKVKRFKLKQFFLLCFVFVLGLVIGAQWYRLHLFPFPQISKWRHPEFKVLKDYRVGTPVFFDRDYVETIGNPQLNGLFLVQIPRHAQKTIIIEAEQSLGIYRMISDHNDNRSLATWEKTDIEVMVKGVTCNHTQVVHKQFTAGKIFLAPMGPVASSPILINAKDRKSFSVDMEFVSESQ